MMQTKTIVIKLGGSTLGGESGHASPSTVLPDMLRLLAEGAQLVIVHGGGKAINQLLTRLGHTPQFKDGLRVTDTAALEAALMVMRGQLNPKLVDEFNRVAGGQAWPGKTPKAIGLTGIDGEMIEARRETANGDIGLVGHITKVNLDPVLMALEWGYVPIIAPFGVGRDPQPEGGYLFNINADSVAAQLAAALYADFCVFLTDVPGILKPNGETIVRLDPFAVQKLIADGVITGGMIPKVEAAVTALRNTNFVTIVDGNQPGALYDSVAHFQVAGTLLVNRDELTFDLQNYQPPAEIAPPFPYTIEPAPLDAHLLGQFLHTAFYNTPDFGYDSQQPGGFEAIVSSCQSGMWGEYQAQASCVAKNGERIIGLTLVCLPPRFEGDALLTEVATDQAYLGQHVARQLLRHTLAALQTAHIPKLRLNVTRGNDAAYGLYRRMGFEPTVEYEYK